jgi:hypothetical protein
MTDAKVRIVGEDATGAAWAQALSTAQSAASAARTGTRHRVRGPLGPGRCALGHRAAAQRAILTLDRGTVTAGA